jgi:hypothetical protein
MHQATPLVKPVVDELELKRRFFVRFTRTTSPQQYTGGSGLVQCTQVRPVVHSTSP